MSNKGNPNPSPETRFGGSRAPKSGCGGYHRELTPRFQMENIMQMNDIAVRNIMLDERCTTFQRSFANCLYLCKTASNIKEATYAMQIMEKMINQVYGNTPTVNINAEADSETAEATNKFIKGVLIP